MKKLLPYIAINAVMFLILPFGLSFLTFGKDLFIGLLVFLNPIYFLFQSRTYAKKNSKPYYIVLINAIFSAAYILIFMNSTAYVYGILYVVFSFLGVRLGSVYKKINDLKNQK